MPDGPAPNRLGKAVPSLPVRSCVDSLAWYCEKLGFRKDFDDAVLGRDEILFAGVSRDEFHITLNQHDEQGCIVIVGCDVADVDALYEELKERGVEILLRPQDEPWGERHMAIVDPDGNELHFSSPIAAEDS